MNSKVHFPRLMSSMWVLYIQISISAGQYQSYSQAYYSRLGYCQPVQDPPLSYSAQRGLPIFHSSEHSSSPLIAQPQTYPQTSSIPLAGSQQYTSLSTPQPTFGSPNYPSTYPYVSQSALGSQFYSSSPSSSLQSSYNSPISPHSTTPCDLQYCISPETSTILRSQGFLEFVRCISQTFPTLLKDPSISWYSIYFTDLLSTHYYSEYTDILKLMNHLNEGDMNILYSIIRLIVYEQTEKNILVALDELNKSTRNKSCNKTIPSNKVRNILKQGKQNKDRINKSTVTLNKITEEEILTHQIMKNIAKVYLVWVKNEKAEKIDINDNKKNDRETNDAVGPVVNLGETIKYNMKDPVSKVDNAVNGKAVSKSNNVHVKTGEFEIPKVVSELSAKAKSTDSKNEIKEKINEWTQAASTENREKKNNGSMRKTDVINDLKLNSDKEVDTKIITNDETNAHKNIETIETNKGNQNDKYEKHGKSDFRNFVKMQEKTSDQHERDKMRSQIDNQTEAIKGITGIWRYAEQAEDKYIHINSNAKHSRITDKVLQEEVVSTDNANNANKELNSENKLHHEVKSLDNYDVGETQLQINNENTEAIKGISGIWTEHTDNIKNNNDNNTKQYNNALQLKENVDLDKNKNKKPENINTDHKVLDKSHNQNDNQDLIANKGVLVSLTDAKHTENGNVHLNSDEKHLNDYNDEEILNAKQENKQNTKDKQQDAGDHFKMPETMPVERKRDETLRDDEDKVIKGISAIWTDSTETDENGHTPINSDKKKIRNPNNKEGDKALNVDLVNGVPDDRINQLDGPEEPVPDNRF